MKTTVFWTDFRENRRQARVLESKAEAEKFIEELKKDENIFNITKWELGE